MPTMYVPPFLPKLTNAGGPLVDGREVHRQLSKVTAQEKHNDWLESNGLRQPLAPQGQPGANLLPTDLMNPPPPLTPPSEGLNGPSSPPPPSAPPLPMLGLGGPPPLAPAPPLAGPPPVDAPPPRPLIPPPPLPADRPPGTFGTPSPEAQS